MGNDLRLPIDVAIKKFIKGLQLYLSDRALASNVFDPQHDIKINE